MATSDGRPPRDGQAGRTETGERPKARRPTVDVAASPRRPSRALEVAETRLQPIPDSDTAPVMVVAETTAPSVPRPGDGTSVDRAPLDVPDAVIESSPPPTRPARPSALEDRTRVAPAPDPIARRRTGGVEKARIENRATAIQSSERLERAAQAPVRPEPATAIREALADGGHETEPTDTGTRPAPSLVAPTGSKAKPQPGSVRRRVTGIASDLSKLIRVEALQRSGGNRGFQIVIAAAMVLLGIAVFAIAVHHDRPSAEALQLAYPYGLTGGRLPGGRTAPPASELIFDFDGNATCGDAECLRYLAHTVDDRFKTTMLMKQTDDGKWHLVP